MEDIEEEEIVEFDFSQLSSDEEVDDSDDFNELYDRDEDADDVDLVEDEESNASLNRKYRTTLEEIRRAVIFELQRCKEKKDIIESRIQELNLSSSKPPSRKNWYNLFGYPYFKDRHFFPCPINEDCKEKKSKKEIDYHQITAIRKWVPSDCKKLEEAVKANAIEMKTSELMKQQGIVLQKLKSPNLTSGEKKNLSTELNGINHQIKCVKNMNPTTLFGDINTSFDWLKITAEAFGELRCSEEVRAMWVLCRHPSINRKHWTLAENKTLKEIALKNKEQDWAKIAFELKTNRSQFQCVIQYQRHVNEDLMNHKWTDEEDEMLKYVIEKCRIGDVIPWTTVTMCMVNRTRAQVYHRWQNSLNPDIKKGRFTLEEDCLIMAGAKRFGKDFARIAELLPGRTTSQVYARYTQSLIRIGPLGRWTKEEDALLWKLAEEEGCKKWHELTKHFTQRNRNQVRHRYHFLKGWRDKFPDFPIEEAPSRNLGDISKRNSDLWRRIQKVLKPAAKDDSPKEDYDALNDEDLAVLKSKLSTKMRRKPIIKKVKALSDADKMLDSFARISYYMVSGRRKVIFNEEEKQYKLKMTMKILNAVQARLTFPFDESIIEEDETWNTGDIFVLLELKKKFDEMRETRESSAISSVERSSAQQCPANAQTIVPQDILPLYSPTTKFNFPFPEVFPGNWTNIVGFRTVLLSRSNLRIWKSTPRSKTIAVPPPRAPKEDERNLSDAESRRLLSERLFALFRWPCHLAVIQPAIKRDIYETQEKEPKKDKRKRKRTIQDAGKARKLKMKKHWMKVKEAKAKFQTREDS